MTVILAVDPGLCAGWCFWTDREGIAACGVFESKHFTADVFDHPTYQPDRVVIELPQVYTKQDGDPNDLIKLATQVGKFAFYYESTYHCSVLYPTPREWKGQLPKEVHHPRIWGKLSPEEQEVVGQCGKGLPKSKLHNMMDAVGLAQWAATQSIWRLP